MKALYVVASASNPTDAPPPLGTTHTSCFDALWHVSPIVKGTPSKSNIVFSRWATDQRGQTDFHAFLIDGLNSKGGSCNPADAQSFNNVFWTKESVSSLPMGIEMNTMVGSGTKSTDGMIVGGNIKYGTCPHSSEVWNEYRNGGGHGLSPSNWEATTETHADQTSLGGALYHGGHYSMFVRNSPNIQNVVDEYTVAANTAIDATVVDIITIGVLGCFSCRIFANRLLQTQLKHT